MTYTWKCKRCERRVDIRRPVAQHKEGPTKAELGDSHLCKPEDFVRVITPPMAVKVFEDESVYF